MLIKRIKELPIPLFLLLAITIWLRLINLGYSDYQGDEVKALYLPEGNQTFGEFIMDQRKGPVQFIVTYGAKLFLGSYSNEFLVRLPFALAAIAAVFFFYKFSKLIFKNDTVAFFASLLFATNGFIVAFSRIVQYQSFVLFFMSLALYMLALATVREKWKYKGLYISTISLALSILAHYDGIFIFPFYLYLLFAWYKKYKSIKPIIISAILSLILLAIFYVPFVITLSKSTLEYWQNRISGGSGKISSSYYLFKVYQPIYVAKLYLFIGAIGIIGLSIQFALAKKLSLKIPTKLLIFINEDMVINRLKYLSLFAWFLCPFIFMEFMVNVPGTHIYTYLVPFFIFSGFGLDFLLKTSRMIGLKLLGMAFIIILFTFITLQSNAIFVDNTKEYPWENEKFLIWEMTRPSATYHLSLFGFPYYRDWEGIRDYIFTANNSTAYATNERDTISSYYIPLKRDRTTAGYYIYIRNSQNYLPPAGLKPNHWIKTYPPVKEIIVNNRVVASLYLMEVGDYDDIKAKGF